MGRWSWISPRGMVTLASNWVVCLKRDGLVAFLFSWVLGIGGLEFLISYRCMAGFLRIA